VFTDPQSVTVSAVAQSLARTGMGESSGIFRKDDGSYQLLVNQQFTKGKRYRRSLSFVNTKTVADALLPANNVVRSATVQLLVDAPELGYTITELKAVVDGFLTYLSASSGAKVTQLLGGEI